MKHTKENVYVHVKTQEQAQELFEVLTEAGEDVYENNVLHDDGYPYYHFLDHTWGGRTDMEGLHKTEFTIPELKQILNPTELTHDEQLKQALSELDALKEKVQSLMGRNDEPKELETGKWYWLNNSNWNMPALIYFDGHKDTYGFDFKGLWCNNFNADESILRYRPKQATDQEVEQALIKEARRRYNVGDVVSRLGDFMYGDSDGILKDSSSIKAHLCRGGYVKFESNNGYSHVVFLSGQWASVIDNRSELDADIQALKDKYKDFNITVIV